MGNKAETVRVRVRALPFKHFYSRDTFYVFVQASPIIDEMVSFFLICWRPFYFLGFPLNVKTHIEHPHTFLVVLLTFESKNKSFISSDSIRTGDTIKI